MQKQGEVNGFGHWVELKIRFTPQIVFFYIYIHLKSKHLSK